MADDLRFAPLLKASWRDASQEPESVWHLRSADGHSWWAVLHFHGESELEAQIFRDGELVLQTKAEAVEWDKGEASRLQSLQI